MRYGAATVGPGGSKSERLWLTYSQRREETRRSGDRKIMGKLFFSQLVLLISMKHELTTRWASTSNQPDRDKRENTEASAETGTHTNRRPPRPWGGATNGNGKALALERTQPRKDPRKTNNRMEQSCTKLLPQQMHKALATATTTTTTKREQEILPWCILPGKVLTENDTCPGLVEDAAAAAAAAAAVLLASLSSRIQNAYSIHLKKSGTVQDRQIDKGKPKGSKTIYQANLWATWQNIAGSGPQSRWVGG